LTLSTWFFNKEEGSWPKKEKENDAKTSGDQIKKCPGSVLGWKEGLTSAGVPREDALHRLPPRKKTLDKDLENQLYSYLSLRRCVDNFTI